ncbi:MAG: GntR family transcriptional regulator [Burkholderiaceae bacterium]|jgi:GntR family transcriptional regulator|nr:GntR family transcriptional regulator [Burkholderiaceae bacterium]
MPIDERDTEPRGRLRRMPGRRGALPLYAQHARLLRHRIETGDWPIGTRLPSLEALAAQSDVAVVTIRQAIELLEREGLVERRQGLGTFVVGSVPPPDWLSLGTSWSSLLELLAGATVRLVPMERGEFAPVLGPHEGSPAVRYLFQKRVHCRGNEPFCIIELYLAWDAYQRDPVGFDAQLVLPTLTRVAPELIGQAWQTLTIGKADPEAAGHLGIDAGDPVAFVRRIVLDPAGRAVYVANITYRADFVRLDIELIGSRREVGATPSNAVHAAMKPSGLAPGNEDPRLHPRNKGEIEHD